MSVSDCILWWHHCNPTWIYWVMCVRVTYSFIWYSSHYAVYIYCVFFFFYSIEATVGRMQMHRKAKWSNIGVKYLFRPVSLQKWRERERALPVEMPCWHSRWKLVLKCAGARWKCLCWMFVIGSLLNSPTINSILTVNSLHLQKKKTLPKLTPCSARTVSPQIHWGAAHQIWHIAYSTA